MMEPPVQRGDGRDRRGPRAIGSEGMSPGASGREQPAPRPPRLLVFEAGESPGESISLALEALGYEAIRCRDGRALVEEAIQERPDAVLYELTARDDEDLGVLELLRRAAPTVPLVLVASQGSLVTRKVMLGLKPLYTFVGPVERAELREVLEAALTRRPRTG